MCPSACAIAGPSATAAAVSIEDFLRRFRLPNTPFVTLELDRHPLSSVLRDKRIRHGCAKGAAWARLVSNQRPSDAQPDGSRDEALKRGKYDILRLHSVRQLCASQHLI